MGWEPTLLTVHEDDVSFPRDTMLLESVPADIRVIKVRATKPQFGIKGLVLRAILPLYKEGTRLLKKEKFDLVYFSTTMFPTPVLGHFWKKRFGVPYIIDMQDPWYSTYYDDKPKSQRPPKHWFSNRMHKYTEPVAMKTVDGIISVSPDYIELLNSRYPKLKDIPASLIPFSASANDVALATSHKAVYPLQFDPTDGFKHLVYIGRAGHVMRKSLTQLFKAFRKGLDQYHDLYGQFKMHFIGTDYATGSSAKLSVLPVAVQFDLAGVVSETTDRIPFFSVMAHLKQSDGVLVLGSDDPGYTASKIYPYLIMEKPLLGIFHEQSPVVQILGNYRKDSLSVIDEPAELTAEKLTKFLQRVISLAQQPEKNTAEVWDASGMAQQQVNLFNTVVNRLKP